MRRGAILSLIGWMTAVLLVAGITHISSVLLLPYVVPRSAFAGIAPPVPGEGFHAVERAVGDANLPFSDPATTLFLRRYDLRAAAWRIRLQTDPESLTTLSFFSNRDRLFHTLTDRASLGDRLEVLLGTAVQIDAAEAGDADDALSREVRIVSPSPDGLVLVRTMSAGEASAAILRGRLAAAQCQPDS